MGETERTLKVRVSEHSIAVHVLKTYYYINWDSVSPNGKPKGSGRGELQKPSRFGIHLEHELLQQPSPPHGLDSILNSPHTSL